MGSEQQAIAAAQSVARAHAVRCEDAVALTGGSNALVHLRPSPVVARVMTATAALHDDVEAWLTREVGVASFLAGRSDAVVPLAAELPPGPHEHDGLWMTFWAYVEHDRDASIDPRALGGSLRALHEALAGYGGDLPPLRDVRDWLARLLADVRPSEAVTADDLDWLAARLDELTPLVFDSSLPAQALHGDASMSNLLRSGDGRLLWNDFEDVCFGPVAWDLCGLALSAGPAADEVLAGYGDPGVEDLRAFREAHAVYDAIWSASRGGTRAAAILARLRGTAD